ncbi:MAG: aldehyde dehydrogenase family protein [Opitutales bacterium]|jgi:NADP-dependent aldehyde dehydrogenase
MSLQPILLNGQWRPARATGTFRAENPATGEALPDEYPVSSWADCDDALTAATSAARLLKVVHSVGDQPSPHGPIAERIAHFLTRYAERIEARARELVQLAHLETGLAQSPRLADVELPRTTGQLRLAAAAALEGSWALPTIDTKANIRSCLAPIGPVWVFGPNNFPFAFNSVAGGDFAAAIAAGNPVIAKANPGHPGTTRLLAEEALAALTEANLPPTLVQLIYHTSYADGERLAADPRTSSLAFTGSRSAGLKIKAAADAAGKPAYFELSSVNPIVILPGALAERGAKIAEEFAASCLLGAGQFCTNPGLVLLLDGPATEPFIADIRSRFEAAKPAPLLSGAVARSLAAGVQTLLAAGARLVIGGQPLPGPGYRYAPTLLRVEGAGFLAQPEKLQTEAFGPASLLVIARDASEARAILVHLDGNLTGGIYSDTRGADDELYGAFAPLLRARVGRLLNDKMPTGVAVSPAMNHGGPYPATGHPGFTAVGIPASLRRFGVLQCYDNVRPERLPASLRDRNPTGRLWRLIDGQWTQADVRSGS